MRRFRAAAAAFVPCVIAISTALGGTVLVAPAAHVRAAEQDITDPELRAAVAAVAAHRTEGVTTVPVEVLTSDTRGVARTIRTLGGRITGSVDGEVVQAVVPAAQVRALEAAPGTDQVQYPRNVSQLPNPYSRTEGATGTGTNVGSEVTITNADAWQLAGYKGAGVKVGIVDYFDLGLWNTAEQGTLPSVGAGTVFCQDSAGFGLCDGGGGLAANPFGGEHGVAVAEIVKDMAPDATLYLASVGTVSDLRAAIDWFAAQGVTIITRSLGSAYDGPGDGSGPMDAVVDYAAGKGLVWFNSAGNSGVDNYVRRLVPTNLASGGYVDFDPGAGVDTWLRLDGSDIILDGVRWSNDWYLGAGKTDYSVEFWQPTVDPATQPDKPLGDTYGDHWDPTGHVTKIDVTGRLTPPFNNIADVSQTNGANPLEATDVYLRPSNSYGLYGGVAYMRVRLNPGSSVGAVIDTLEVGVGRGLTELGYSSKLGSAARPVVDSKNPALVAVGAVHHDAGTYIAPYSSQGPTNDGRIKPDLSAPSGLYSTIYAQPAFGSSLFYGTSAAAPTAAGAAAVLQGAGLVGSYGTSAMLRDFALTDGDLGTTGPDNAFGAGELVLPDPPTDPAPSYNATSKYVPLAAPVRVLDTRPAPFHVGPSTLTGPYPVQSVFEYHVLGGSGVPASGVSAVVVNITSTNSRSTGFVQAYPYLKATTGGTSTLNIFSAGATRANFAVLPVGANGNISVYLPVGGNAIIDVMGYYADNQTTSTDGRFVPLATPERWMDTRGFDSAPLPVEFGGTPRRAAAGEVLDVPTLPGTAVPTTGVSALVVTLTSANALANGFLRVMPKGTVNPQHSNLNYDTGAAVANVAIVPLGLDGQISVGTPSSVNVIVDVVGYITSTDAPLGTAGLFMPIQPGRAADTRQPTPNPILEGGTRRFQITGLVGTGQPVVPSDAIGITANLTVTAPAAGGWLKVYPGVEPPASNLNYGVFQTVAVGALLKLDGSGGVTARMIKTGHVIIDVNGYFLP